MADSSRRSAYCSAGPQWMWKRWRVSTPPMSMHSMGQAWAHWKHVSHLSAPASSKRRTRRPRWRGETSGVTSGYCTVGLRWSIRMKVRAMPLAMPRPGRVMRASSADLLDDEDRRGSHEDVDEGRGQKPLPGEAHQLIDPDPGHAEGGIQCQGAGFVDPHDDFVARVDQKLPSECL